MATGADELREQSSFSCNFIVIKHEGRKESRAQGIKRTGWYSRLFHEALTFSLGGHLSKHLFPFHMKETHFHFEGK